MSNKKAVYDVKGIKDALDVDEFFSISDLNFLNVFEKFNDYYIYENDKYKIAFLIKDNKISQKTYLNNDFKPHRTDGAANIIFSNEGYISLLEFFINGEQPKNHIASKVVYDYIEDNGYKKISTIQYFYITNNKSLLPSLIIYDNINKKILEISILFNNKIVKINIFKYNNNEIFKNIYNSLNELEDLKDLSSIADTLKIFEMELY
jgi:hypothetical protein